MKLPGIFGGWISRKNKQELEKQDFFDWKYLDEESSKKLGLEQTTRPDVIIYTELNKQWAGRLRFHTLPGSVLSAEHFSINQSLNINRKDFQKILFGLLNKLVEIMEEEEMAKLEIYITNPAVTRFLVALGAKVTFQRGASSSLSWNLDDMRNLKLRRMKLIEKDW